jgi:hypothetical protein
MNWPAYIHWEHALVRKFGRFAPIEAPHDQRVIPRNMRRRWARRYGMGRVPIVVTVKWLTELMDSLRAELDRRQGERDRAARCIPESDGEV